MIERYDVNEDYAHSGIIKAGDFYYLGYCVGNIGGTIEEQINGAFDQMGALPYKTNRSFIRWEPYHIKQIGTI